MKVKFSEWQAIYLQAMMEPLDSADIPGLVERAETAAARRLRELAEADAEERHAINLAVRSLGYIAGQSVRKLA
jgi:hypothetical protein